MAEGSPGPLGLLVAAAGALAVAAILNERSKATAQTKTSPPDEVTLHRAALSAVQQARAQIHLARYYAEQLSRHAVDFDVKAKLDAAFVEPLPSAGKAGSDIEVRQPLLFMVEDEQHLPALREALQRYVPAQAAARPEDGPGWARAVLRQAINTQGGLWSASRAHVLLTEHGWRSESERPVNVVGNLLAAMERDGEIERTGRGMYTSIGLAIAASTEQEVAPGVFASEASPGVWVITGLGEGLDVGPDRQFIDTK
jgi:hypothetical protein